MPGSSDRAPEHQPSPAVLDRESAESVRSATSSDRGGADRGLQDPAEPGGDAVPDTAPDTGSDVDVRRRAPEQRPALSVGAVARRLGVATSTLRTWDRRYGLGPHSHAEGSHRRYTDQDVERLALMRRLVQQGVGPAEAARIAVSSPQRSGPGPASGAGPASPPGTWWTSPPAAAGLSATAAAVEDLLGRSGGPGTSAGPTGCADDGAPDDAARPERPDGPDGRSDISVATSGDEADRFAADFAVVVQADGELLLRDQSVSGRGNAAGAGSRDGPSLASAQGRRLAQAVLDMDSPAITALVGDSMRREGVVASWESLVSPVLRAIGRRWELTGAGIEVEHLLSECVLTALHDRATHFAGDALNTAPVLLACVEEEQHSLPIHAVAAALAERQVGSRVLGARLPSAALLAAVARIGPSAVFLWAQSDDTAGLDLTPLLAGIDRLVLGGLGWASRELPVGVLHVVEFPKAVDVLAALAH